MGGPERCRRPGGRARAAFAAVTMGALLVASDAGAQIVRSDFNGDRFDDLAIGVPNERVGSIAGAGAVMVLYGSASGLSATANQVWSQGSSGIAGAAETNDHFGAALAAADFDLDGFADLAVGVPGEDFSEGIDDTDAGAVNVLYGSPSGLTASRSQFLSQGSAGVAGVRADDKRFGSALAAGVLSRGIASLVVGVPGDDGLLGADDEGSIVVINGVAGAGLAGDSDVVRPVFDQREAHFGASLAIGDFDHDGFGDVMVGTPDHDTSFDLTDNGNVQVLPGSLNGLDRLVVDPLVSPTRVSGEHYGFAIASGDVNGDGFTDLLVGAPDKPVDGQARAGAVDLYLGTTNQRPSLTLVNRTIASGGSGLSPRSGDRFGAAVALADLNGDGRAELIVGAPGRDVDGAGDAGMVLVSYANPTVLLADPPQVWHQNVQQSLKVAVRDACEAADGFGSALGFGDLNGDTFMDLAIGVPGEDLGAGAAAVLYGGSGGLAVAGNQLWRQGAAGLRETAEGGDRLGASFVGSNVVSPNSPGLSGAWSPLKTKCAGARCRASGRLVVTNPGQQTAAASVTRLFVSRDDVLDAGDTMVKDYRVRTLPAGGAQSLRIKAGGRRSVVSGARLIAVLDVTNVVPEVDESNNVIVTDPLR